MIVWYIMKSGLHLTATSCRKILIHSSSGVRHGGWYLTWRSAILSPSLTLQKTRSTTSTPWITSLSTPLTRVYLGVTVNSRLRWNQHIDQISAAANHMLGFLMQTYFVQVSSTLEGKDLQSYRPSQAGILFQHLGPQIENSLPQQKKFANFNEFSEIKKIRKNSLKNR